jgi:hypothetical protein
VLIEVDSQLGCAVDDVFAVNSLGEGFVFHLFADSGDLDVVDRFCGFDEGAGGEKSG